MPASAATRELTVADTGFLNHWVFTSRREGLVGTRDVPLLLLDLEEDEDVAGFLRSTTAIDDQRYEETEHFLEVGITFKRLQFCIRLPLPEYQELADDILKQSNVALGDFDAWYGDDGTPRNAILVTFAKQ